MTNKDLTKGLPPDENEEKQPEMLVNDYGSTLDPAVVVEEADRTVLLTNDETMIIEKEPRIDIVPANRPRKIYSGMWGPTEIATVGIAGLAVLLTILVYVFLVIPSDRELAADRAERDRLERELASANSKYGNITSTETQVSKLIESVNDFELNNLPVAAVGKNTLYQRINSLIASYGLVNTSGPDYVPLETADQNAGQEERGRGKFRSIFPGVYITMTLDGSYQDLRRFIADIERSSDFLIISAIELEPADSENPQGKPQTARSDQQSPAGPQPAGPNGLDVVNNPGRFVVPRQTQAPAQPRGKTHGETVSLRLEMAGYFRRPNFVPMATSRTDQ